MYNKEAEYIIKFNSINNGYNERIDINSKCITSVNTRNKMSISGKKLWANGNHKNHNRKLSKFQYNIYDINNNILDKDITSKEISDKYNIASSNIFQNIKKKCINQYGVYDETITFKLYIKHYFCRTYLYWRY